MCCRSPTSSPTASSARRAAWHYAFYLNTHSNLVLWHFNKTGASNEWTTLADGPVVTNGAWARFTIEQDYRHGVFQVRVNSGLWITNASGWTDAGGTSAGGSWFYMAQNNGAAPSNMTLMGITGTQTNYMDDLVLTNRQVTWSASGFTEGVTNNGTINSSLSIAVLHDTFTGNSGDDFVASNKLQVANLPANLTAVATYSSPTQLTVRLNGTALQHEAINSTNLVFTLQNTAFTLGNAADVGHYSNTLSLTFSNTPAVSYSSTNFTEDSGLNDGSINNLDPMVISLTNALFNGTVDNDFYQQGKVQVDHLPGNLVAVMILTSPTQLSVTLTNRAALSDAANSRSNLTFTFLDAAFSNAPACGVQGASCTNLLITFLDIAVVAALHYDATVFAETPANDGSVAGTALVLSGKEFAGSNNEDYVASGKAAVSNVPDGLALQLVQTSPSNMTLGFASHAINHRASHSVSNLTVTFANSAFTPEGAASVSNAVMTNLVVQFHNPPYLAWDSTTFTEAAANDGTMATTNTVTLSGGATFTGGNYTLGNQFTTSGVPVGLSCSVWCVNAATVKVALSGNALAHSAANITNFTLQFQDAAFSMAASEILGSTTNLAVQFADPAQVTYSGDTFTELSQGTINNTPPITITLTGDAFTGANGVDFAALHKVVVSNVPVGLTAVISKSSDTVLSVTLTGPAYLNDSANNVANLTVQFQDTAFSHVAAARVTGSLKPDLKIVFSNDTPFAYTVPYEEPFESYTAGVWIPQATNGWSSEYPGAGTVTAETSLLSGEHAYGWPLPIETNHTQTLNVQSDLRCEIHSAPGQTVYLDFMMWPTPMVDEPPVTTNMQFAFFVSTNSELVLWHQNWMGAPINELRVLTHAQGISTNRWMRLTVCQDYSNAMFQVQVNKGGWISDAAGWTVPGTNGVLGGTWFHMVQTNSYMSRFGVTGFCSAYFDDLTVRTSLPTLYPRGSIFTLR